jgi:tRNA nucleotidyltransferase/poly(A) polymerase
MIDKFSIFVESMEEPLSILPIDTQGLYDLIPNSVKEISVLFKKSGKNLYLVGGSVRDYINEHTPKDFDVATDAMPDEVMNILKDYRTQLQGEAFGVVVVFTEDQPLGVEIATFRQDISKGRNPEVKLGVTIEEDVERRDLTYNAMFFDIEKKVIYDITGGMQDLKNGITRMVGDPFERIDEDALRILRAFRFAARYEHKLDEKLIEAFTRRNQLQNIDPDTGMMKRISSERIYEEMKKAWDKVPNYNFYLEFFNRFNMWPEVFPGANINTNLVETTSFNVCLANLFRNENIDGLSKRLTQNYTIDSDTAETIEFLLRFSNLTEDNAIELKQTLNKKNLDVENIKEVDIKEWIRVEGFGELHRKFLEYQPTNWGKELIRQGWKQGPELGKEIANRRINDFRTFLSNR